MSTGSEGARSATSGSRGGMGSPVVSRRGMILDQTAFVHLLDEVVDGGAAWPCRGRPAAQVVVCFVDRGILAVRLPFDQDGQCLGIADAVAPISSSRSRGACPRCSPRPPSAS